MEREHMVLVASAAYFFFTDWIPFPKKVGK